MKILLVHTPFNWRRPLTIVSFLIRKVTGNYYNHCAFLDGFTILESDVHGVVSTSLKDWTRQQIVSVYDISELANIEFVRRKAYSQIGKFKYSFADLLWFMPIYLLTGKWFGRTVEDSDNKPTCYEYVARCLNFENWHKMDPETFISQCKKYNYPITHLKIKATEL